jgi:hypothetical protein
MRRMGGLAVPVVVLGLVLIIVVGLSDATSSPILKSMPLKGEPPTDLDLRTTTLTGEELAEAAGIPKTRWIPGKCDAWVEISDGDPIGYCIPVGLTQSAQEKYRVGRLLRGHIPSDAQVAEIEELITGAMSSS